MFLSTIRTSSSVLLGVVLDRDGATDVVDAVGAGDSGVVDSGDSGVADPGDSGVADLDKVFEEVEVFDVVGAGVLGETGVTCDSDGGGGDATASL